MPASANAWSTAIATMACSYRVLVASSQRPSQCACTRSVPTRPSTRNASMPRGRFRSGIGGALSIRCFMSHNSDVAAGAIHPGSAYHGAGRVPLLRHPGRVGQCRRLSFALVLTSSSHVHARRVSRCGFSWSKTSRGCRCCSNVGFVRRATRSMPPVTAPMASGWPWSRSTTRSCSTSCCRSSTASRSAGVSGPRAVGRQCCSSPRGTASTIVSTVSTPAPTTT